MLLPDPWISTGRYLGKLGSVHALSIIRLFLPHPWCCRDG